nr:NAD(P)/FAD-dependent oxidoreductase [Paenibacillus phyllosphaerae]
MKKIVDGLGDGREVTVVGGGFIGVEMAGVLAELGLRVTLVEAAPYMLAPFDSDMVKIAEREMQAQGVRLLLSDSVTAFHVQEDTTIQVALKSGASHKAELVILAIGVAPSTEFIRDSGIELGPKGHILVNDAANQL